MRSDSIPDSLATSESASRWIASLLAATGSGHTPPADWQCPAHSDASPSLYVAAADDGGTIVRCRAGCRTTDVLAALHLWQPHLWEPPGCTPADWRDTEQLQITYPPMVRKARADPRADPAWHLASTHDYGPHFRLERWRHAVTGAKDLRWWSRNSKGEMVPGLLGRAAADLPLYRQGDIGITAATGDPLYVVESESSVDALNGAGHYATTWAGGAGTPPLPQLRRLLLDHPGVVVVPDHDRAGLACGAALLAALPNARGRLPPTAGQDIRDVIEAGDRRLATLTEWNRS